MRDVYKRQIKKNVNTGWLLVIAIVGGIALSAAGILA